ncbi:hypothetical protein [Corynebacterium halotolerans]|uniref:hypothetical protein n=1 Tax=Corynebacterium halotolerans TaxID=225326 RepID=UPI003CF1F21E
MTHISGQEGTLIRARIRQPGKAWHTTGITMYSYIQRHHNKKLDRVEKRSNVTIKDIANNTEIRFKWSEIKALHASLTELMEDTTRKHEQQMAQDAETKEDE